MKVLLNGALVATMKPYVDPLQSDPIMMWKVSPVDGSPSFEVTNYDIAKAKTEGFVFKHFSKLIGYDTPSRIIRR